MKAKSWTTAFLVIAIAAYAVGPAYAQTGFVKFNGNPVISVGAPGSWDDSNVVHPFVLFDGSVYRMWYAGSQGGAAGVGLATSSDGVTWTKYSGNPVLTLGSSGSWDSAGVGPVSVLFDGTTYKMWYTGATGSGITEWIGLATSTDGIHWAKYLGNPVISSAPWTTILKSPYVILKNGTYWMYFAGFDNVAHDCGVQDSFIHFCIGLAKSTDGITWNVLPKPVLTEGPSGSWDSAHMDRPVVMVQGTVWHMWYTGQPFGTPQIGYASSSDGISWTKFGGNPILTPGSPGSWDSGGVSAGTVILDSSGFKMWYSGADTLIGGVPGQLVHFQIGLATEAISPPIMKVKIDIKPGHFPNTINHKNSGTVPVGILSGPGFSAPEQVDRSSLTFGRTGTESSLSLCNPIPKDVNNDGLPDLVCHFDSQKAAFRSGDTVGILRGLLIDGTLIEGTDSVRIK